MLHTRRNFRLSSEIRTLLRGISVAAIVLGLVRHCGAADGLPSKPLLPRAADESGKWGYADALGKFELQPKYDFAAPFFNGIAVVRIDKTFGAIDNNGNLRIPTSFEWVGRFSEGLVPVRKSDRRYEYLDLEGQTRLRVDADAVGSFFQSRAWIDRTGRYGYIGRNGEPLVEAKYQFAGDFNEGRAVVQRGGTFGFINIEGNEVGRHDFKSLGRLSDGLACFTRERLYGYVNPDGKEIIGPKYQLASTFRDGVAVVQMDKKSGLIDTVGKLLIGPSYDDLQRRNDGGFVGVNLMANELTVFKLVDAHYVTEVRALGGSDVEVTLKLTPNPCTIYRPTEADFILANRDIQQLMTPDFCVPAETDTPCVLDKYTAYHLIFSYTGKKPRDYGRVIPHQGDVFSASF